MQIEDSFSHHQSYERTISLQRQQINQLKSANQSLRQQLQQVTHQRNQLNKLKNQDPIYKIFQQYQSSFFHQIQPSKTMTKYQDLERRLQLSRNQNEISLKKINILQNRLRGRENELKASRQEQLKLLQQKSDLQKMVKQLKAYSNIYQDQIEKIKQLLSQSQTRSNQLNQEVYNLSQSLIVKQQETSQQIQKLSKNLRDVSMNWYKTILMLSDRNNSSYKNAMDQNWTNNGYNLNEILNKQILLKFKKQDLIMQQMGKQLDSRNQQIQKLILQLNNSRPKDFGGSMSQQQISPLEKVAFKTNIKSFYHLNHKKTEMYTQLLQKYKQLLQKYQKSINQKKLLQQQYSVITKQIQTVRTLKQQYRSIKFDYENYKSLYERLQVQMKQNDRNTEQILKENQAFHRFMHEQFGAKLYLDKIEQEVRKYEIRMKERQKKQKWANIEELLQMNRKLRNKLVGLR